MRVITVSNFKGGVGKTTTAVNLAALCARRGLRTLLVDLDPQASATDYFGLYAEAESGANVIGLLYEGMSVEEMAYDTATENLKVVPASLRSSTRTSCCSPSSRSSSRSTTRRATTTLWSSTPRRAPSSSSYAPTLPPAGTAT